MYKVACRLHTANCSANYAGWCLMTCLFHWFGPRLCLGSIVCDSILLMRWFKQFCFSLSCSYDLTLGSRRDRPRLCLGSHCVRYKYPFICVSWFHGEQICLRPRPCRGSDCMSDDLSSALFQVLWILCVLYCSVSPIFCFLQFILPYTCP